jgi:hypothetical protein
MIMFHCVKKIDTLLIVVSLLKIKKQTKFLITLMQLGVAATFPNCSLSAQKKIETSMFSYPRSCVESEQQAHLPDNLVNTFKPLQAFQNVFL